MVENRKYERVPSRLRCWCEGENVTFYARVGNLSEGGLFLRTSTPLEAGAHAELRLGGGELQEVQARAIVRWARGDDAGGPPGMGLEFERLEDVTLASLRALIRHVALGEALDT